jgi:hypothetical protein
MRVQTGLSFVAGFTAKNMPLHVSSHLRPKEVISEDLLSFLGTKTAHKSTRMSFLHKQNANRTIWNAEFISSKQKPIMQMELFPSLATTTLGIWFSKI